eukprot:scaffold410725_cov37-Prasinocladus_malaysianus.AAC.1
MAPSSFLAGAAKPALPRALKGSNPTCRSRATASRRAALPTSASHSEKAKIAVLGASGYTGAEVMRLMALHPGCE